MINITYDVHLKTSRFTIDSNICLVYKIPICNRNVAFIDNVSHSAAGERGDNQCYRGTSQPPRSFLLLIWSICKYLSRYSIDPVNHQMLGNEFLGWMWSVAQETVNNKLFSGKPFFLHNVMVEDICWFLGYWKYESFTK